MTVLNKVISSNSKTTIGDIGISINTNNIPELKQFNIFHCTDEEYMFTERENQPRKWVATVFAHNIEDALKKAQNESEGSEYKQYNVRSTSIGDVIQDSVGFYMVGIKKFIFVCKIDNQL